MKRKFYIFPFVLAVFCLLCLTTYAAVTGSTIIGEAVNGATVYELYQVNGTKYTLVDSSDTLEFDLSGYGVGEYTFVVRAKGVGYLPSDYSNEVIYTVEGDLPEAPVLTLNGSVVSWNPVDGATDYHIRVYSIETVEPFDEYREVTGTSFDLSTIGITEEASYYVSVWGDCEAGFGEAAAVIYTYDVGGGETAPEYLIAPSISYSADGVIVWDAVPGASFYTVYVNDSSFRMTSNCRLDLTSYASELAAIGSAPYSIYVKASGEGYADSAASNTLTYNGG